MAGDFPPIAQSRFAFWGVQQYTRNGMWWFTLVFGLFGLHHFLLRSPFTGLMCFLLNIITLGYWYAYDLVQLSYMDTDALNKFGMSGPFGPLGIAEGMWVGGTRVHSGGDPTGGPAAGPGPGPAAAGPAAPAPAPAGTPRIPPKGTPTPWFFMLYCITLAISPLAHSIGGDLHGAFTRFLLKTIVPLGSIIYMAAMVYDYFILLVNPGDLCMFGSKRVFPFTVKWWDKECHSTLLTGEDETVGAGIVADAMTFFVQNSPQGLAAQAAIKQAQVIGAKVVGPKMAEALADPDKLVAYAQNTIHTVAEKAPIYAEKALDVAQEAATIAGQGLREGSEIVSDVIKEKIVPLTAAFAEPPGAYVGSFEGTRARTAAESAKPRSAAPRSPPTGPGFIESLKGFVRKGFSSAGSLASKASSAAAAAAPGILQAGTAAATQAATAARGAASQASAAAPGLLQAAKSGAAQAAAAAPDLLQAGRAASQAAAASLQKGGGNETTTLDYFAGAVIAAVIGGGLLIGTSRNGRNDSPPKPGNF